MHRVRVVREAPGHIGGLQLRLLEGRGQSVKVREELLHGGQMVWLSQ